MVHLKSLYPQPPPVPDLNIHQGLFNAPGQADLPNYLVQVDISTGRERRWFEFRDLVYDGMTALAAPASAGGLGVDPAKDIVGIFSHNCLDYITLVNSLLAITVPFAMLSAFSTPFELKHTMRTAKVTVLFVEAGLLPKALEAAKEVGLPDSAIHLLEGKAAGRRNFQDMIHDVRTRGLDRVAAKPATKNTLAYLVFSSGTSGLPKAVMCSHGNAWAMIFSTGTAKAVDDGFTKTPPPTEQPVTLLFLPFHHAYGLYLSAIRPFSVPITTLVLPRWDVNAVMKAIPKYRVNVLPMIPSAMHQMVHHPDLERTDFSSLRVVLTGAAYTPPALAEKFKSHVKSVSHINEGYGASEMTLTIGRKFPPGCFGLTCGPGCTGALSPGVEGRIVRADGTDADYDEPGELHVRGESLSPGYFNNEAATRETFVDGWFRTGDTLRADKNGLLYFVDRAKDTLKVSGAQVSPTEIEEVLRAQPDGLIADVCVAGVSGGRTADEKNPRAWVVLSAAGHRRGAAQTLQVLDAWAKKNLSSYKWLRGGFEVVDQIPKNPTGKVMRRVLQERYEQTHGSAAKAKL